MSSKLFRLLSPCCVNEPRVVLLRQWIGILRDTFGHYNAGDVPGYKEEEVIKQLEEEKIKKQKSKQSRRFRNIVCHV